MNESVLVVGETLVDFLPDRPGPLSTVAAFERRPGGAPANVAVGLTRLETPPSLWTRVGDDPFGQYLLEVLRGHGLSDDFFEVDSEAQTTLAFVTHDASGDRTFSFYRDGTADTRLEPGTIPDDLLDAVEWVHAGGVTLSSGRSREATIDLMERARAHECTVSFDPNVRQELWADRTQLAAVCREALSHTDVCKATVEELEMLGFEGDGPEPIARSVLASGPDDGPETVFLTRGGDGSMAVSNRPDGSGADVVTHPGFEVDVVDTTGAGDAFVAALISSRRADRSLEETLEFANAVAAQVTTEPGAMTALPTRRDLEPLLDDA